MRKDPEAHKKSFRQPRAKFVQNLEADPRGPYEALRDKTQKSVVAKEMVFEERKSGRRVVQKWTFCEASVYQGLYAGKQRYEHTFGEELTTTVNNEELKGRWARGDFNSWMPGHHLVEYFDEDSTSLRKLHEDGQSEVVKNQAQKKYDPLVKPHLDERKRAAEKAAKPSGQDLLALLARFGRGGAGSSRGQSDDSQDEDAAAAKTEVEATDDSNSEPEDSDGPADTLFHRRIRAKAVAKSAALRADAAKLTPKPGAGAGRAGITAGPARAGATSAPGTGASTISLIDDGRLKRLRDNVTQEFAALEVEYGEIFTLATLKDDETAFGKGAAYKEALKKHSGRASDMLTKCKAIKRRVESSKQKDAFADLVGKLGGMIENLNLLKSLVLCLAKPEPPVAELDGLLERASQAKLVLSSMTIAAHWLSSVELHVMHGDCAKASEHLTEDSPFRRDMMKTGCDSAQVGGIAKFISADVLVNALSKIKLVDVAKKGSSSRSVAFDIATAYCKVELDEQTRQDAAELVALMDPFAAAGVCGIEDVVKTVEKYEEAAARLEFGVEVMAAYSAIQLYVLEHEVGKALVASARGFLDEQQPKLRANACIARIQKASQDVEAFFTSLDEDGGDAAEQLAESLTQITEAFRSLESEKYKDKQKAIDGARSELEEKLFAVAERACVCRVSKQLEVGEAWLRCAVKQERLQPWKS